MNIDWSAIAIGVGTVLAVFAILSNSLTSKAAWKIGALGVLILFAGVLTL